MSLELFTAYLVKLWIFAASVTSSSDVAQVPGAWSEVSSTLEHCLMYRAPLDKSESAKIAIFHRSKNKLCVESQTADALVEIKTTTKPTVKIEHERLVLKFEKSKKNEAIQVPLWGASKKRERLAYIGRISHIETAFLDQESECTDNCRECPRGFIHIVTEAGLKKICHEPTQCGAKDQPVCFLGNDWNNGDIECRDNSKLGWCQEGLMKVCSTVTGYLSCE